MLPPNNFFAESKKRYKQTMRLNLITVGIYLGIILLSTSAAYWIGLQTAPQADPRDQERLQEHQQRISALQEEIKDLKQRLPEGQILTELFEILQSRLRLGVTPERLRFVLTSVTNAPECQSLESKLLQLSTPTHTPRNRYASFNQNALLLRGRILPPDQIEIIIALRGILDPHIVSGPLPLFTSLTVDQTEYRLTFFPDQGNVISVSLDLCSLL